MLAPPWRALHGEMFKLEAVKPAMTVSSNWPLFTGYAAVASLAATLCAMVTDTDWYPRALGEQ